MTSAARIRKVIMSSPMVILKTCIVVAIELIFAHPGGLSALTTGEEKEAERSDEIAVFPLAIPLIAGPASITATMLLMRQADVDPVRVVVLFLSLLLSRRSPYSSSSMEFARAICSDETAWT